MLRADVRVAGCLTLPVARAVAERELDIQQAVLTQEGIALIRIDPFAFFDGVPENVVPDNLRSGVSQVCRSEPDSAWHAM